MSLWGRRGKLGVRHVVEALENLCYTGADSKSMAQLPRTSEDRNLGYAPPLIRYRPHSGGLMFSVRDIQEGQV